MKFAILELIEPTNLSLCARFCILGKSENSSNTFATPATTALRSRYRKSRHELAWSPQMDFTEDWLLPFTGIAKTCGGG